TDPLEHAKAVIWLCENPEEAKQMGNRGRMLVMEKYSWQKEFKNFKDFYVQMLK
ncbi:MAG: glycosyltransferase family 1 protein, partial [Desulfobacula sp.]|nr:glycosyltransferase family 1 protein [Desulfobacula sp.]